MVDFMVLLGRVYERGEKYYSLADPKDAWIYCSAHKLVRSTDLFDDEDSSFSLSSFWHVMAGRDDSIQVEAVILISEEESGRPRRELQDEVLRELRSDPKYFMSASIPIRVTVEVELNASVVEDAVALVAADGSLEVDVLRSLEKLAKRAAEDALRQTTAQLWWRPKLRRFAVVTDTEFTSESDVRDSWGDPDARPVSDDDLF